MWSLSCLSCQPGCRITPGASRSWATWSLMSAALLHCTSWLCSAPCDRVRSSQTCASVPPALQELTSASAFQQGTVKACTVGFSRCSVSQPPSIPASALIWCILQLLWLRGSSPHGLQPYSRVLLHLQTSPGVASPASLFPRPIQHTIPPPFLPAHPLSPHPPFFPSHTPSIPSHHIPLSPPSCCNKQLQ